MEECVSCGRTLTSQWNFCIYCGRPMAIARPPRDFSELPADEFFPQRTRKYDAQFWLGITMSVAGIGTIIVAATTLLSASA